MSDPPVVVAPPKPSCKWREAGEGACHCGVESGDVELSRKNVTGYGLAKENESHAECMEPKPTHLELKKQLIPVGKSQRLLLS